MAVQITSDSIIKILVRRGLESERLQTVLTEGELGYSIDTRRLFVGDGVSLGGSPAGNKFLGETGDKTAYVAYATLGDTIYETNVPYAYNEGGTWLNIGPKFYQNLTNGFFTIEQDPAENKIRISPDAMGEGFALGFPDTPLVFPQYTVQSAFGQIQFDAQYLSLCAANNSFYFGNVGNRTVRNNFDARVNVSDSLFINDSNVSPNQICITTRPASNNATIESVSGNFDIQGKSTLNLFAGKKMFLTGNSNHTVSFSSARTGVVGTPDFDFYGRAQFRDHAFFSTDATVFGNLSVVGDLTYLDTVVTVTSTLSVVNYNENADTVVIKQQGVGNNQSILRVEGTSVLPYLVVKDGPVVSINYDPGTDQTYDLITNGSVLFFGSGSDFKVLNTGSILLSSSGTTSISGSRVDIGGNTTIGGTARVNSTTGSTDKTTGALVVAGGLGVNENIYAGGDIVAFNTSDERLKDNVTEITSALHKISQIRGVEFDWNSESNYTGHDVGIIAQEIEKVLPEAVITREDGYKAVRYEKLVPLLIQAIKELSNK
jgi:hypothetical protein